jgi:hypothetical protein
MMTVRGKRTTSNSPERGSIEECVGNIIRSGRWDVNYRIDMRVFHIAFVVTYRGERYVYRQMIPDEEFESIRPPDLDLMQERLLLEVAKALIRKVRDERNANGEVQVEAGGAGGGPLEEEGYIRGRKAGVSSAAEEKEVHARLFSEKVLRPFRSEGTLDSFRSAKDDTSKGSEPEKKDCVRVLSPRKQVVPWFCHDVPNVGGSK